MFFMNLFSGHGTLIKGEGTTINFFFPKELGPTEKYGLSVTIKKIIKFLQTRNLQFSHRLINLPKLTAYMQKNLSHIHAVS